MVACTWIGFSGYTAVFIFFLIGTISTFKDILSHVIFGLNHGFFFKYSHKKGDNPITNIIFFAFMAGLAIWGTFFYLLPIIQKYWLCLMLWE